MVKINSWFTLLIVTSLTFDVTVSLQCPISAVEWNRASLALQCKLPNSYHCLKDEKDVITEQCLAKVWIEGGMCPVYSSRMSKIDVIECSTPSCPQSTYWSNSVFLYPVCFETMSETLPITTTLRSTIIEQALTTGYSTPIIYNPENKTVGNKTYIGGTTSMKGDREGEERGNTTIYIVVGAALILGIIVVVTVVVICRRRKESKSRNHDRDDHVGPKVPTDSEQERKLPLINKGENTVIDNGENIPSKEFSLESRKCPEESRKSQLEDTKGTGISEEGMKSAECTCEVYVASGPNLPQKAEESDAPQVLMLVRKNPLEKKQIDEHAKNAFGSKYVFCWKMSHYQKHKQEEQVSVLVKGFDFKSASVEEILEKLLAVVAVVETRVAFVVAVPLEIWSLNRENIAKIEDADGKLICKTAYV